MLFVPIQERHVRKLACVHGPIFSDLLWCLIGKSFPVDPLPVHSPKQTSSVPPVSAWVCVCVLLVARVINDHCLHSLHHALLQIFNRIQGSEVRAWADHWRALLLEKIHPRHDQGLRRPESSVCSTFSLVSTLLFEEECGTLIRHAWRGLGNRLCSEKSEGY